MDPFRQILVRICLANFRNVKIFPFSGVERQREGATLGGTLNIRTWSQGLKAKLQRMRDRVKQILRKWNEERGDDKSGEVTHFYTVEVGEKEDMPPTSCRSTCSFEYRKYSWSCKYSCTRYVQREWRKEGKKPGETTSSFFRKSKPLLYSNAHSQKGLYCGWCFLFTSRSKSSPNFFLNLRKSKKNYAFSYTFCVYWGHLTKFKNDFEIL